MKWLVDLAFGIYLIASALIDIKYKKLPLYILILGIVFVPAYILFDTALEVKYHFIGIVPGIIFFIISFATKGQVGLADCAIVLLSGASLGIGKIVSILTVSFISVVIAAMVMLLVKKLNRKSTIPYIPFLFWGYIVTTILGY